MTNWWSLFLRIFDYPKLKRQSDFYKFSRRMRLFAYFHKNSIDEQHQPCKYITSNTFSHPFECLKSKILRCTTSEGQHPSLDSFLSKCRVDINNIQENNITSMHSRISHEDKNANKTLQNRKVIVIKPADKSRRIVAWRRNQHVQKQHAKSPTPISTVV